MRAASSEEPVMDSLVVLRPKSKKTILLSRENVEEQAKDDTEVVSTEDLSGSTAQLPLYYKRTVYAYATIDADLYERLSQFKWVYDPARKAAFRDITEEGQPDRRIHLHREVRGSTVGDNRTTKARDGDLLNCVRSNLYEGPARKVPQLRTIANGKSFPRQAKNFVGYLKKNYKNDLGEFVEVENIRDYGPKKITLSYEDGTDECKRAHHHSFREKLMNVLQEDFEFPGSLNIIKHIVPPPPPRKPKVVPVPEAIVPTAPPPPQVKIPKVADPSKSREDYVAMLLSGVRAGFINDFSISLPSEAGDDDIQIAISRKPKSAEGRLDA